MLRHLPKLLTHYRGFQKEHREDPGPISPDTHLTTQDPQPPSEQGATPAPQTSSFITRTGYVLAKWFLLLHRQLLRSQTNPPSNSISSATKGWAGSTDTFCRSMLSKRRENPSPAPSPSVLDLPAGGGGGRGGDRGGTHLAWRAQ